MIHNSTNYVADQSFVIGWNIYHVFPLAEEPVLFCPMPTINFLTLLRLSLVLESGRRHRWYWGLFRQRFCNLGFCLCQIYNYKIWFYFWISARDTCSIYFLGSYLDSIWAINLLMSQVIWTHACWVLTPYWPVHNQWDGECWPHADECLINEMMSTGLMLASAYSMR